MSGDFFNFKIMWKDYVKIGGLVLIVVFMVIISINTSIPSQKFRKYEYQLDSLKIELKNLEKRQQVDTLVVKFENYKK